MHPHAMLQELVADRRREVILDASPFRRGAGQSRGIRLFSAVRRVAGHRLIGIGQALAGPPVSGTDFAVPAGRRG